MLTGVILRTRGLSFSIISQIIQFLRLYTSLVLLNMT